jgi:chromate reductase, NAD(P)H dehydrogenase (quinone)
MEPFMARNGLFEMQKILAIPGSLRADSSSHELLRIISQLIPLDVSFEIYTGVGQLPHFDGSENPATNVQEFRKKILEADGVLICTPEYAFGVPGSLKNALDWTVSSAEFVSKPVALVTASSQGEKAHEALQNTLTAISADLHPATTLLIPFIRAKVKGGKIIDQRTADLVKNLVEAFIKR